MNEQPKHPTYGTLDQLLAEIRRDVSTGYYVRIGLQGALYWFSDEYAKLRVPASGDDEGQR